MHRLTRTIRTVALAAGIAALPRAAVSGGRSRADGATALTSDEQTLWKYVARCALPPGERLEAPARPGAAPLAFDGGLGLAPEWRDGTCDAGCQERVSSCLLALTNPTGYHVRLSMLSVEPALAARMSPDDNDREFPFQEGAFFGNFFEGEGYACHGSEADKGVQLKRLCAVAPALCGGFVRFADAGRCQDSCEMSCAALSDGSSRCVALRCHDPNGRVWTHPITTYLRDRLEVGNTDELAGASRRDGGLAGFRARARAVYRRVDFGRVPGGVRALVASVAAPRGGGRIDISLAGSRRRLGSLAVSGTAGLATDLSAPLGAHRLSGPHNVVLTFTGLDPAARVADFGLR